MVTESVKLTWGLYCRAGFLLCELTSGLILCFQSYEGGSLLTGLYHRGNSCWTANLLWSGYVRDQRSAGINTPPTDQSDLIENDVTIHQRSCGAQSEDDERVSEEEERVHRATNLFKCIWTFLSGGFMCVSFSNCLLQTVNEELKRWPFWT